MLKDIIFIAARTVRSQAYAQCLARLGLEPRRTIIFGPSRGLPGQFAGATRRPDSFSLPLPDLTQSLKETCAGWDVLETEIADVNDPTLAALVADTSARYAIYSGFGGQIVGRDFLAAGPRLIHVHPGRLPEFRGSTTIYYTWLALNECQATAFLMSADIDAGEILCSRNYMPPPSGLDVDYLYDGAIRSDLLATVLEHYRAHGELPREKATTRGSGGTYYVIHPVLKHLALLSREVKGAG